MHLRQERPLPKGERYDPSQVGWKGGESSPGVDVFGVFLLLVLYVNVAGKPEIGSLLALSFCLLRCFQF